MFLLVFYNMRPDKSISFLIFFYLINTVALCQTTEQLLESNRFNQEVYLFQEAWHHLKKNERQKVVLLDNNNHIISSYIFYSQSINYRFNWIIEAIYNSESDVYSVSINNKKILKSNCTIINSNDSNLWNCVNKHIIYCCDSIRDVKHLDFRGRLIQNNVELIHRFSENCAKVYEPNDGKKILRVLRAYWKSHIRNSNPTLHFTSLIIDRPDVVCTMFRTCKVTGYIYSVSNFY